MAAPPPPTSHCDHRHAGANASVSVIILSLLLSVGAVAGQERAVPFARYVPADVNVYVVTRELGEVSAALDRANAWRLLQVLSGDTDGAGSGLLRSVVGFFGVPDDPEDGGFTNMEVGVAARSWADPSQAVWFLRPASAAFLERLIPSRGGVEASSVGDATVYRTRAGLTAGVLENTVVTGRGREPGSILARSLDLMGGSSTDSLVVSPAFRELAAYLPADPLTLVYASGSAIAPVNPSGTSLWRPSFERAAAGLYEGQGRIDVAVRAALAHPRRKAKLSEMALERLFRLPDTTLFASAFTFDFGEAVRAAAMGGAPTGTLGRYLRLLTALQAGDGVSEGESPSLGPHVLFVWGQNLGLSGSVPQVAVLIECRDEDGVAARASKVAEQAARLVRLVDRSNAAAPLVIERRRHLGTTIFHIPFDGYAKTSQAPFAELLTHADPAWAIHNGWLIVALSADHVESILDSESGLMPRLGELRDVRPLRKQALDRSVLSILQAGLASDVLKTWVSAYEGGSPSLLDAKWWNGSSGVVAAASPFGFEMGTAGEPGTVVVSHVLPRGGADGRLRAGDRIIGVAGALLAMDDANADFRRRWDECVTAPGPALRVLRDGAFVEVTLPKADPVHAAAPGRIDPGTALREFASLGRTLEFASFGVNVTDERHYSARLSLRFVPEPTMSTAATAASDKPRGR